MIFMATEITTIVDIPPHTVCVPNGKTTYIYLTKKTYRNSEGGIRNDRICIGKMTSAGKMTPNHNYYVEFDKLKPQDLPDIIRNCGTYAVCKQISEKYGLENILKEVFPDSYNEILTAAQYILVNGSVMYYIDDWLDGSISFCADALDDVAVGRVFKSIGDKEQLDFFKKWLEKYSKKEFVAYDVTSISSYSEKLSDIEFGYNRDKEKLPQLNYGMYYAEESRLPLYYCTYPGSINDKTHCKYMIDGTKSLDCKNVYFVMDKGFYTKENLQFITESGNRFVITMPPDLNLYKN